jgi:hypothetical protein
MALNNTGKKDSSPLSFMAESLALYKTDPASIKGVAHWRQVAVIDLRRTAVLRTRSGRVVRPSVRYDKIDWSEYDALARQNPNSKHHARVMRMRSDRVVHPRVRYDNIDWND